MLSAGHRIGHLSSQNIVFCFNDQGLHKSIRTILSVVVKLRLLKDRQREEGN
jgi:hypothetical protein